MSTENATLTKEEIEACKPRPGEGGKVLRALCPFHGSDKQRSLRINLETGRFSCFACGAWGYTEEARERFYNEKKDEWKRIHRPSSQRRDPLRPPPVQLPTPPSPARDDLDELLAGYQQALPGSLGEQYLAYRKIPLEIAVSTGVGYAAPGAWAHSARDWKWGRLVFPHTDPNGMLVNLYGRAVGKNTKVPKYLRHDHLPGEKGYFHTSVLTNGLGPLFVTEGPFDALSLLAAGCDRSIAIYGVHGWRWEWVRNVREIIFALDQDNAGASWKALARGARLRGKHVSALGPEAYGGENDVAAAWAKDVLIIE